MGLCQLKQLKCAAPADRLWQHIQAKLLAESQSQGQAAHHVELQGRGAEPVDAALCLDEHAEVGVKQHAHEQLEQLLHSTQRSDSQLREAL